MKQYYKNIGDMIVDAITEGLNNQSQSEDKMKENTTENNWQYDNRVNIIRSKDGTLIVNIVAIGIKKEQINIEYNEGLIIVYANPFIQSGDGDNENINSYSDLIKKFGLEFVRHTFDIKPIRYSFEVKEDKYDIAKITSTLGDGILTINVPLKPSKKPVSKKIIIS